MIVMLFLFFSSLIIFLIDLISPIVLRKRFNINSRHTARTISICISYLLFDLTLILSFFITKEISELLYISSFNIRTLLICIVYCYSGGFVFESVFKNIYHKNKLFMFLFINNAIISFCTIFINNPFMFYVHIAFAILQTIVSILIFKSIKSNI